MPDLQQLAIKKEKILGHIKDHGPSLPVHIAKALGVDPLFASAFLAELVNDQQLKTSNLRVGSSPLYHLSDQTDQLENFAKHLNRREREAFQLLKSSQLLEDTQQEPAIRVALRAIKDFAIPLRARMNNSEQLFWRYFLTPEAEAKTILQKGISKKEPSLAPTPEPQPKPTTITPTPEPIQQPTIPVLEIPQPSPTQQPQEPIVQHSNINSNHASVGVAGELASPSTSAAPAAQPIAEPQTKQITAATEQGGNSPPQITTHQATIQEAPQEKPNPVKKQPDLTFTTNAQAYLETKNIQIKEWLNQKKKEGEAIAQIETQFGLQTFYLHLKDKKTVSDTDLTIAFQKAQTLRMPALFAAPGKLTKKAEAHLQDWQHLIKFEQLKP